MTGDMDEVISAMIAEETDPKIRAILENANAIVEHEYKLRKRWDDVLVRVAKSAFETLLGVKQGDMVEYRFICSPKKVIYDDVCMDKYGDLKVRCYHLKNDGTPRAKASLERWSSFYTNEIKFKPESKPEN